MRKADEGTVMGIRAPGPRATPWAALLAAGGLALVFLVGLGLWGLVAG